MYRILLVDDDRELLAGIRDYFMEKGFEVYCAENAKSALEQIKSVRLDCVVLDIDLPDQDGFQVCTIAREYSGLPIIFLSAYTEEESRIQGLTVGADDYVCKPFSLKELELRIAARIRPRYEDRPSQVLTYGDLKINTGARTVTYGTDTGSFSRIEFDILAFLSRHPGQVFSYEQLYDTIWQEPINEARHTLQARMAEVRQKLSLLCPGKNYIVTIRRKGYLFSPEG